MLSPLVWKLSLFIGLVLWIRSVWRDQTDRTGKHVTRWNAFEVGDTMNYKRCAELHNKLVHIGWDAVGYGEPFPNSTWWDTYGDSAKAKDIQRRSPTFAEFLKLAIVIPFDCGMRNARRHHLFYLVDGLRSPKGMQDPSDLNMEQNLGLHHDDPRFITIYQTTNRNDDLYEGVLYDLHNNDAIYVTDVDQRRIAFNGRQAWYPLEDMLLHWHSMIHNGRVVAMTDDVDRPPDLPKGLATSGFEWSPDVNQHRPWMILPYSKGLLDMCLNSWERLIEAIEDRIPGSFLPEKEYGLYDAATLDLAEVPSGFVRDFLSTARKPRVEYLAAGMRLVNAEEFVRQPFLQGAKDLNKTHKWTQIDSWPIPLLRAFESVDTEVHQASTWYSIQHLRATFHPAGLYLDGERWGAQPLETSCRISLPFGIGSRGNMRYTDGSHPGEKLHDKQTSLNIPDMREELYQPGFSPFGDWEKVSLHSVLDSWTQLVEQGEWKVSEQGVAESIAKWKDADSWTKWHLYHIPQEASGRTADADEANVDGASFDEVCNEL